jgi:hypothetical protein
LGFIASVVVVEKYKKLLAVFILLTAQNHLGLKMINLEAV